MKKKEAKILSPEEIAFNKYAKLPKGTNLIVANEKNCPEYAKAVKLMKIPKIKKKKVSLRKLCSLAWGAYGSKYFRFKDMLERGNPKTGLVKCCTCSNVKHWSKMDGGHFIPKAKLDAWLLENNAHCQCFSCNQMKGGNLHYYLDFMIEKYGAEKVREMKEILYRPKATITRGWIAERRKFFKSKLKEWKVI